MELEIMTDRPTNQLTNRKTDMRGHREVSLAIMQNMSNMLIAFNVSVKKCLFIFHKKDIRQGRGSLLNILQARF